MGNLAGGFWADPVGKIELTMLAFAVFFALLGVTTLIFRRIGYERAFALGLMVSQRNMGLMLAATDGVLPGTTWLYFALSNSRSICRRSCSSRSSADWSRARRRPIGVASRRCAQHDGRG